MTVAFADLVISILRLLHAMTIRRCMHNLRLQGKRAAKLLTSAGWPAGGPAPEALRKGSQVRLTRPAAGVRSAIGIESPARAPLRKRGQGPVPRARTGFSLRICSRIQRAQPFRRPHDVRLIRTLDGLRAQAPARLAPGHA